MSARRLWRLSAIQPGNGWPPGASARPLLRECLLRVVRIVRIARSWNTDLMKCWLAYMKNCLPGVTSLYEPPGDLPHLRATSSAHAPDGRKPTTREPSCGPEPSAAARSTVPARSQPGRNPGSLDSALRTSPRLSETAATRTRAFGGLETAPPRPPALGGSERRGRRLRL
jgi:hypothetical protein